jgi:hypothetical protein
MSKRSHEDAPAGKEMLTGNANRSSNPPHENKNDWIDFGAMLFWNGILFRCDPQLGSSKLNESTSKLTPETAKIRPTYISLVQFTTRASKPPSKLPNGCPPGPSRCSRWESLLSRCIGLSVGMNKCASSRPRTKRRLPVRCWQRHARHIRTQTMRAFTASEMEKILGNVP